MPLSTIKKYKNEQRMAGRITRLKSAVQGAAPGICVERPLIWTEYNRNRKNRKKPSYIRIAEALREVLMRKTITIYPDELIVGNYTSKRVGGSIYPELAGMAVMGDIFKFRKKKTSPLEISGRDIARLLAIVPFWLPRFLGVKAYRSPVRMIRLAASQFRAHFYLINESGGISHLAPDYEKLISVGTDGIIAEAARLQERTEPGSRERQFYEAVKIAADALARFGERYAELASEMASRERDPVRRNELEDIAKACANVPRKGARSFHEAVQSVFFAQVAINLESMDNSVCPGRMDQYL